MHEYLADVAQEMSKKSDGIRRDFKKHNPTSGENLEDIVAKFLKNHLPKRFAVKSGLVISHDGMYSNQADLIIVDEQFNAPLYPDSTKQIWPVESVYALIEVKAKLDKKSLADAVAKGRRFKSMQRRFYETKSAIRRIDASLYLIWAFESLMPHTLKRNFIQELSGVPVVERPDLSLVLGGTVVSSGTYLETVTIGEQNSQHRRDLLSRHAGDLSSLIPGPVKVYNLRDNALWAWCMWVDAWLRQAGGRIADPFAYLPEGQHFGEMI